MCKSRPETKSEDEAPKQNYSRFFSVLSFIFISLHLCKRIINKDLLYIMAKKIKTNVENPQELENLENAVLTSEAFIEKHQKKLNDSQIAAPKPLQREVQTLVMTSIQFVITSD
jgi:hypothetical protein